MDYHISTLTSKPQDLGFHAVSRNRNFHLLVHKAKGQFISNPQELYESIAKMLRPNKEVTLEALFWEQDPDELRREVLGSLTAKRLNELKDQDIDSIGTDWTRFLTSWEQENPATYSSM